MTPNNGTNSRGGSCEIHEPRLSAYLLDELSSDERRDVEAHVSECPACREELALLGQTAEALRASPPVEGAIAPERREALLAAAREEAVARPARKGPWGPAYRLLGLAAAVAVSFVGVRLYRQSGEDRLRETEILAARTLETQPADLTQPAAAVEPVDLQTVALADDTLALKARVEELAQNVTVFSDSGIQTGTQAAGVERDKLYAWSAPAPAPESESRRSYGAERGPPVGTKETPRIITRRNVEPAEEVAKLGRAREELRSAGLGGAADAEYARMAKPGADRAVLYKQLSVVAEQDGSAVAEQDASRLTDLYLTTEGALPLGGSGGGGGGAGVKLPGKAGDAVRGERELRTQLAGNSDSRKLEESLLTKENKTDGLARGGAAPAQPADGRDLTTNATDEWGPPRNDDALSGRARFGESGLSTELARGTPAPRTVAAPPGAAPAGPSPAKQPAPAGEPLADAPAEVPLQGLEEKTAERAAAASASLAARPDDWKVRVDDFLSRLDRRPGETPAMMFFRFWGDNAFVETSSDRLSTFGADVDTASYTLFRAYLYKQGVLPPSAAPRTEEFVNYFRSRYAPPSADGAAFAIHADLAPSPFAHEPEYQILKVGLKGREVAKEKRKAAALVFVVDTSGSMRQENRLELVKDALRLLVRELDEGDSIGIVAFDREARTILEPSPAAETERILSAIATLEPRQNTNVAAGLELGYRMAAARKIANGANRVILLSDGVANTGVTDPDAMVEMTRAQREQGIFLTCVGVGMGNNNDALLERLADRGNGQCVYVDRIEEAKKVFVENLAGTLETIAKDVKIQVEFDPARVIRYRLLGYENRNIADADFRDNKVDAGEVGAGHEVTALYELKLKPAATPEEAKGTAVTIRVRYLTPEHGEAVELKRDVTAGDAKASFSDAPPRFQVSACAAELAEVLRESYWARGGSLEKVAGMVESILSAPDGAGKLGDDADVVELVALLRKADALVREREARASEVARTAEALKENAWLRTRIQDELQIRRETDRAQLDEILRQNLELRQRLEGLLRG